MKSIKEKIPLSVKQEIKHVWNYITKKDYRIAWKNNRKLREYRTSYGDSNPDKIFYVIRRNSSEAMGSVLKNCIGELEYARKRKYIPVVDYKNYYDFFLQNQEKQGVENAWEYYFKQVSDYSLEEVYKSKNVILSNALDSKHWIYREKGLKIYTDHRFRSRLAEILNQYCFLSDSVNSMVEYEYSKICEIAGDKKVLGVCAMLREADIYNSGRMESNYKGRALQPTFEELVKDIKESMVKFGCEYVFISDDSDRYHFNFQEIFGDRVIFSSRAQVSKLSNDHSSYVNEVRSDSVKYTKGYLTDIYLLARCDSLLASECSTSQLACLINNNKYDYEKIYHIGIG